MHKELNIPFMTGARLNPRTARESQLALPLAIKYRNENVSNARRPSIKAAIAFAKPYQPDAFLAVGGGSVIDVSRNISFITWL